MIDKADTDKDLHPYYYLRECLSVQDGIILKGEKIIIPMSMRPQIKRLLHASHLGTESMQRRARELIYWPGMNDEIKQLAENCDICQRSSPRQQKEPMIPHEIPQNPWQIVATDLFSYKGRDYIVIVDFYSRYPEFALLNNCTAKEVIMHCKSIFARHGIPSCVKSDNGPCYASEEFRKFAQDYGFKHITSSPRYPQSNGLAERTVQTIKNILKKSDDPYLGVLEYRNSPIADTMASPAQMLMSRRLRSTIPSTPAQLAPRVVEGMKKKLTNKQAIQKHYYDRGSRQLSSLPNGEVVRVQLEPQGKWKPAIVQDSNILLGPILWKLLMVEYMEGTGNTS